MRKTVKEPIIVILLTEVEGEDMGWTEVPWAIKESKEAQAHKSPADNRELATCRRGI